MTDEQGEALQERLKELDAAGSAILDARKPFDDALRAVDQVREGLYADAGLEPLDEICETCERHLFVGDLGHRCADGPVLCEECSPTWNELKTDWNDGKDADDLCHSSLDLETIEANIARGYGDKKHVWPL